MTSYPPHLFKLIAVGPFTPARRVIMDSMHTGLEGASSAAAR
jgi:hypothetical protein